jgi:hypothetical protein
MFSVLGKPFSARLAMSAIVLGTPLTVIADDDDNSHRLKAEPVVFVGKAGDCGELRPGVDYPAGSRIVTAAWLGGMGLPDNGGANTTASDLATNPNKRDPHLGLLLSKNGPTPDCSAAGAEIKGFKKGGTITELGFDFRKGGHCGAGAPRFNLTSDQGWTYFAGCSAGAHTPAPQDPAQWERVRHGNASVFAASPAAPPFVFGTTRVDSIAIIYDEGTDAPSAEDPNGVGLAVIDNIDINRQLITRGSGIEPKPRGGDEHDD